MRVKRYPLYGFTDKLTNLMAESNMTLIEMADIIGVERKTLANYRDGVSNPDTLALAKICKLFNVSADWLLGLKAEQW